MAFTIVMFIALSHIIGIWASMMILILGFEIYQAVDFVRRYIKCHQDQINDKEMNVKKVISLYIQLKGKDTIFDIIFGLAGTGIGILMATVILAIIRFF